jgi:LPPG:FO 2-phospho-L-lactate transferase
VATEYLRLADGFVLDREDTQLVESVRSLGMQAIAAPTVMRTVEDRVALARAVLDFARNVREVRALEVE